MRTLKSLSSQKINRKAQALRHQKLKTHQHRVTYLGLTARPKSNFSVVSRLVGLSLCLGILVSGFHAVSTQAHTLSDLDFDAIYSDYTAHDDNLLTVTEGGFFGKGMLNPTEKASVGANGVVAYTIQAGDTPQDIATNFGVTIDTLIGANGLYSPSALTAGRTIKIPPVDGILYVPTADDNLDSVAKRYNISLESILTQNNLATAEDFTAGSELILPGAKPLVVNNRYIASSRGGDRTPGEVPTLVLSGGDKLAWPTTGTISQYYRSGHYAIDISNRTKPMIVAVRGGTVITAAEGWGGGYGNHVIIDHGDGVQTLYAHCDYLSVSVGDSVKTGDVIGRMGNTGRVYGATGIHLHFEVRVDGRKQNPLAYL